jgi:hypothetical protein
LSLARSHFRVLINHAHSFMLHASCSHTATLSLSSSTMIVSPSTRGPSSISAYLDISLSVITEEPRPQTQKASASRKQVFAFLGTICTVPSIGTGRMSNIELDTTLERACCLYVHLCRPTRGLTSSVCDDGQRHAE